MRATRLCWVLRLLVMLLLAPDLGPLAEGQEGRPPEGPFRHHQCLDCHSERDPALVAQWRAGPHGETAECTACHGDRHGTLAAARSDGTCTGCHQGAVAHSYATSKHGVLVQIGQPDWRQPLRRGVYRAPGCAYCHLQERDHGDTMAEARGPAVRDWVCSACHAPRYVREQLAAGERLLEVGQLKLAEAAQIADRHPGGSQAVGELLATAARHGRNLRLGAGHQSPDYQWWHGQAALDGDLIRLRAAVAQAERQAALGQGD